MPWSEEDIALQKKLRDKYAAQATANLQMSQNENELGVDMSHIIAAQQKDDQARLEEMKMTKEKIAELGGERGTSDNGSAPKYDVKVCGACCGEGNRKNYYQNRELIELCTSCDGEGCLRFDNKTGQRIKPTARDYTPGSARRAGSSKAKKAPSNPRRHREKLHARVEELGRKASEYESELAGLQGRRDASADPQEQGLIEEVMTQIRSKITDLEKKIAAKQKEMDELPPVEDTSVAKENVTENAEALDDADIAESTSRIAITSDELD